MLLAGATFTDTKTKIHRTLQTRIVMDPAKTKDTLIWMQKHLEKYERTYGRIPSPEEIQQKFKKDPDK